MKKILVIVLSCMMFMEAFSQKNSPCEKENFYGEIHCVKIYWTYCPENSESSAKIVYRFVNNAVSYRKITFQTVWISGINIITEENSMAIKENSEAKYICIPDSAYSKKISDINIKIIAVENLKIGNSPLIDSCMKAYINQVQDNTNIEIIGPSVIIFANVDCKLFINGGEEILINKNKSKIINVISGENDIKATRIDGSGLWEEKISVKEGEQKKISITISECVDKIVKDVFWETKYYYEIGSEEYVSFTQMNRVDEANKYKTTYYYNCPFCGKKILFETLYSTQENKEKFQRDKRGYVIADMCSCKCPCYLDIKIILRPNR